MEHLTYNTLIYYVINTVLKRLSALRSHTVFITFVYVCISRRVIILCRDSS